MAHLEKGAATVAVIGAGPAGLAVAACLQRSSIPFALWDRSGIAGGSFRWMPRDMRLLSPRRYVHLPFHDYPGNEEYPSVPRYERYLQEYAARFDLSPVEADLIRLTPTAAGFLLESRSGKTLNCRFVVVATGMYSHPVWPEIDGLTASEGLQRPTVLHVRDVTRRDQFAGQRLLVIGAGISGVAQAEEAAEAGAQVTISRRATRVRPISPRLLGVDILHWFRPLERLPRAFFGGICRRGRHAPPYDHGYGALVRRGRIEEVPEVTRVRGSTVSLVDGGERIVDAIVVATGYRFATPFLDSSASPREGRHPAADANESRHHPGLFFVGAPCARHVDSEYLRGIASDAPRVAASIRRRLSARTS